VGRLGVKVFEFVQSIQPDGTRGFADGVYFGLGNEAYHADPALGSSNIRDLLVGGPTFWWKSSLNPARPDKRTRALDFGTAVHAMVLEGREEFLRQFAPTPDGEDLLRTDADLKKWLTERGEAKIPRSKAEKVERALLVDPAVRIEDVEKKRIEDAGRTMLSDEDWARVLVASAMIQKNPELATAFQGGIPEVSVFWTMDGVRLKCRFDYLKPRAIVDLKSLGNTMGDPFPVACRKAIARSKMEVQAGHYMNGRRALRSLFAEGQVFGDHDQALLQRIVTTDAWGWAWVFIQSVEAPLTWATSLQCSNPIAEIGAHQVLKALDTFRDFMARFGRNEMWLLAEPVTELDQSEMPGWWGQS
jgi:hypothetical protein